MVQLVVINPPLRRTPTLVHQLRLLLGLKETRHFAVCEQSVDPLKERRVHHVAFIHDETNLLVLRSCSQQDIAEVFIEIFGTIVSVRLHDEDRDVVHPSNEPRQRRLPRPRHSDQQRMPLILLENAVQSKHMIKHFVKQHKINFKSLLLEYLHSCFHVVLQFIALNRYTRVTTSCFIARHPVGKEDWPLQGRFQINTPKVLLCHSVDHGLGPLALVIVDESIMEQAQCFVCPHSNKICG
mmetsp:Transcript_11954/g.36022  ORF Transcript_11954/g.36022 Transcript_11954/m.36022 type:complete len:239 (-) Transcript_11954:8480-9196(-)